jgi:3-oxoacyl-[acyl-carrier-protein] synthase III
MNNIRAAITGIGAYFPEYILTNDELSKMVDTSDEWIMQRIGIKERRIVKNGHATSYMGTEATKELFKKTGTKPEEIEVVVFATITPDMIFPSTACLVADNMGIKNAFCFDVSAACSGFIYALQVASSFIESGKHKKVLLLAGDTMSYITDYSDRNTCPLFGDAATALLLEPCKEENTGLIDYLFKSDGIGRKHLYVKASGSLHPASHETVDAKMHYIYQEGQAVFKWAVSNMADISVELMKRNKLTGNDVQWVVPHQANMRIIDAVARRMGTSLDKVMINIEKYGNTTAATIPLCLWEWEKKMKKGDNVILAAFGAGFTWGATYLKWAYNS